ncbi:uncharacterized protein Dmoj_GI26563, partial [Drosophila mojavensis]
MKVLLVFVLISLAALASARKPFAARYDNFKVYRAFVEDNEQLEEFKKIHHHLQVHILHEIGGPNRSYDVIVGPLFQRAFEQVLHDLQVQYDIIVEDLQALLDESSVDEDAPMDWETYHPLDVIYDWVDEQCDQHDYLECQVIGHSYEGRPIKSVKLSKREGNKAIVIEGNIHAMEWISSAT